MSRQQQSRSGDIKYLGLALEQITKNYECYYPPTEKNEEVRVIWMRHPVVCVGRQFLQTLRQANLLKLSLTFSAAKV